MPREKILALWHDAQRRDESKRSIPPADTVLTRAAYEVRLSDHEFHVTGRIRIAKLRGDWQTVNLPFGGLAIESARLDEEPARFGRKDDGTLFLLLKEEGRAELELEMSAPVASRGGDLATTLKLPPVPASEMLIHLDEDKQLQVGETMRRPERTDGGQQLFRLAVDPSGLVPLLVSDRFTAGKRSPLIFAHTRSVGHVEPAGLRWEALVDLEVYGRATDSFELRLPDVVDIAEVEAPRMAQWTMRKQRDDTAVVTVNFRKPFLGGRAVRLLGLAPAPPAMQWDFPTIQVRDVASHVGEVLLYWPPSLRVEPGTLGGIRPKRWPRSAPDAVGNELDSKPKPGEGKRSDEQAMPDADNNRNRDDVRGNIASVHASPNTDEARRAFAFWNEDFRLPLNVMPRRQTLQVSVANLVEVEPRGVELRSSVSVEPRHAPVFSIQFEVPGDWEITSVLSGDDPVAWESLRIDSAPDADGGWQIVDFDLATPLSPGQSREITLTAQQHADGWLEQDEGFTELPFPVLRVAGADTVEGTVLIHAPPDIELLVSDLSSDVRPVAAERRAEAASYDSGTALQYQYQNGARVSGRLRIRKKPAKVSAETLAFVRLERDKLDVHYQLDLHIEHGKIRRIRFSLPTAVGDKIQIVPVDSSARVIEQESAPLPNGGDVDTDLSLWRIVLDRPVTGDLTLAVDFERAFSAPAARGESEETGPSGAAVSGAPVAFPVLALQDISRQNGMVALEAASDQRIDYEPVNMRELDPADVLKPKAYVPRQRIVAAYQYQRLPYRLTISATRHASRSVLTALCESAEITSVAGRAGRTRHQARYWLRSLNLQHLPVTLPKNADLWSVLLDGKPVQVRQKLGDYIVPLPAGTVDSTKDARELTLLYETVSPPMAGDGLRDRLSLRTIRQSAPEIAMKTLGTTWQVHPPEGTELVSSGGDFQPVTRLARPTLVNRLAETIAYQSRNLLSWKFGGLVVAIMAVVFVALIGRDKGCAMSLLRFLVVLAILGLVIALLLPATQSAREAARRVQCANHLKQIGLALHNYHDTHGQFPAAVIGPDDVPREKQFSWMVAILPFLEQQGLYDALRLDLPWDHPHNAGLLQVAVPTLSCPSDTGPSTTQEGFSRTSYVAITGADWTMGEGSPRGVIGPDTGLSIEDIVDGTDETIMVGEVTDGGPWFAGGSATARRIDDWLENKAWSHHPGGGNFVFVDGRVQFLGSSIDVQTLRRMATARGKEPIDAGDSGDGASTRAAYTKRRERPQQPAPQAARETRVREGERARLSLRVGLETHGEQAVQFQRPGGSGELVLELQDGLFARTLRWFIVAVGLLAAWIWRHASGSRRGIAAVVGLAAPIGLSGLVPLAWAPVLDGVLLGTLAAGFLWLLPTLINVIGRWARASAMAATVVGLSVLLMTETSVAKKESDAKEPDASTGKVQRPDLTLFIPYDPETDKPRRNTRVYLPHDEFLRLWKKAHPDETRAPLPDVRTIVSYAEYSGRLQNDVARFDGRLLIHHLDDEWARVALPLGDVALEKIEIDGQPAALVGDDAEDGPRKPRPHAEKAAPAPDDSPTGENQPAIFLKESGAHVVDVRFSVPVSRLGATGRMTVPLHAVPSGRLLFRLPADDLDVRVNGCSGGWRRQPAVSAGEDTGTSPDTLSMDTLESTEVPEDDEDVEPVGEYVNIPLGAASELSIRWQPRRAEERERQLVSVDQSLLVEVRDSGIHFHGGFQYRIQQGTLNQLRFRVPPAVTVQRVDGPEVADWSIETDPAAGADAGPRQLVISLKTELATSTDVSIQSFRRDHDPGEIEIQGLEPLGVVRETGRLALGSADQFRVGVNEARGLDRINHGGVEWPREPHDTCTVLSAYRYNSRPWRLLLRVK
ncbi:MAG: DUF1559 domain-containing protein, partial [Pirellulaceae bacterium]